MKLEARLLYEGGPYSHTSAAGIGNGATLIQGPYHIPNACIEGWAVATNNGMCGPLRGFGVVQAIYRLRIQLDKLARELNIDPVELRVRNALARRSLDLQPSTGPSRAGAGADRDMPGACRCRPALPRRSNAMHPVHLPGGVATPSRPEHVRRGVALAAAVKNVCLSEGAPVNSTAMVTLRDGVATIDCAAAEVGQGFVTIADQIVQNDARRERGSSHPATPICRRRRPPTAASRR